MMYQLCHSPLPLPPPPSPLQAAGCLRAAVDLTARFLSAHGQGLGQAGQPTVHTHKTLQVCGSLLQVELVPRREREGEREREREGEREEERRRERKER